MMPVAETVLAIDPGREKCGVALLAGPTTLERCVLATADLVAYVTATLSRHALRAVVVGNRTGAAEVEGRLKQHFPGLRILAAEEEGTTLEARRLYFADHPPRGLRRLLPRSLLTPPEPYDDYAAVALGRRYVVRATSGKSPPSP